jgi:hypothetical protein
MVEPLTSGFRNEPRLGLVSELVAALDAADIAYCHWKSNENLRASVQGRADLDLLFDPAKEHETRTLLKRVGFARFRPAGHRYYPGIDDFIGIDPGEGRLVHVHAHFRLVLGEAGLKSYELDWSRRLLERREWDEQAQIYRSDAASELLLLLLREAIKLDRRRMRHLARGDDGGATREFAWLNQRVSAAKLAHDAAALLGQDFRLPVERLCREGITADVLSLLRELIDERLGGSRSYSRGGAALEQLRRGLAAQFVRRARRLGLRGISERRRVAGEGLVAAFIGADGSGKSTVSKAVCDLLAKKVDVEHMYMGSGRGGRAGAVRRALEIARFRKLGGLFHVAWALSLAREKRRRLRRIARWREEGIIVICDRFPQNAVEGYNDGPLLGALNNSRFAAARVLARWERACYDGAVRFAPDLVFRMQIDVAALARRRPDMTPDWIRTKQAGIDQLRFGAHTREVALDAGQPLDRVIRNAMAEIGTLLRERAAAHADGAG